MDDKSDFPLKWWGTYVDCMMHRIWRWFTRLKIALQVVMWYVEINTGRVRFTWKAWSQLLSGFHAHSCFEAAILALLSRRISMSTRPVKYQVMDATIIATPTKPMAIANDVS